MFYLVSKIFSISNAILPVVYLDVRNPIINNQGYELFNKAMGSVCIITQISKFVQIKHGYYGEDQ